MERRAAEGASADAKEHGLPAGVAAAAQGHTEVVEALLATVDFSDLVTAPGGCFRIEDTAKRAIGYD